jgi:Ca2+-transporting ATPase
VITIVHQGVPGRARFRVDALYRSRALQRFLEVNLVGQGEVLAVVANPLTSTIKVEFEPNGDLKAIAGRIEAIVADYQQRTKTGKPHSSMVTVPRPPTPPSQSPQADSPWHALPLDRVADVLETTFDHGLPSEVAGERLALWGLNQLTPIDKRSSLSMLVAQFTTWPVGLLTIAGLLSVATGSPVDAVVIMGVVGINAVIGFFTESQSEKIIRSLQQTTTPSARVIRSGQPITLNAAEVVPGDILDLQVGQEVPADARIIQAQNLTIDESALTGESIPTHKAPLTLAPTTPLAEQNNLVFKGTLIITGQGRAVVVATGKFTEIGKIQALVGNTTAQTTPLQNQLDTVSGQLVLLCGVVCAAIFGVGVLRGYGLLHVLKTSISLAVAAVPEGLPAVATTTLALGIQTMRQRKILIRALNAVEALGAIQVICLDKTGTITHNQMAVQAIYLATGAVDLKSIHPGKEAESPLNLSAQPALAKLLQISALCNESTLSLSEDGSFEVQGSPTENALMAMALAAGIDVTALRQQYPLASVYRRTDNRNVMSTLHQAPDGQWTVAIKGSPEEILERCTRWLQQGQVAPLSETERQYLIEANQQMADQALRVLAVAYRDLDDPKQDGEADLIWLGLVGLADPIREGVPELIANFHRASIDTIMLTGDQSSTARAIGQSLNLNPRGELLVMDACDLSPLDNEALQLLTQRVNVFARISPAKKLQIVQALQAADKVVAMTGDGINDTPALKAANVGLAMGSGKSLGVHEVADVVIQDDNLHTLVDAVSQGRTIYTNIRKAVHFLLATNLSEIMVVAVATLIGLGEPLNAIQLLWLNLVTDVFPGLGLALEPPEPNVLDQPPRNPDEPIIKPADFQRIAWEASVISASALGAYGYGLAQYGIGAQSSTIAFMGLTIAQVLHTFSCRSENRHWFSPQPLPRNRYVEVAIAGSLALQLLPLIIPGLNQLLKLSPLQPTDYWVIIVAALLPLVVNEMTKSP